MNKISRLFLVFLLTILTVFAVSACAKKEDKQDNKTTMTEEPGIPLETYLNGNFKNITDIEYKQHGGYSYLSTEHNYKLSPKGHISQKNKAFSSIMFYHDSNSSSITSDVNFKISKYKNYNVFANGKFAGNYYDFNDFTFISRSPGVWNGYEIIYNFSYYKDGKNIYTKNIQLKQNPTYGTKRFAPLKEIANIDKQKPGLYVLEIKLVKHLLGYWDTHDEYIAFKNLVFAFQIGDGIVFFFNFFRPNFFCAIPFGSVFSL